MKLRCVRIVFFVFLISWMGLIFFMSSREADSSAQMSATVGMEIGHVFVPGFDDWSIEKQEAFAQKIDHPVRKCAHAGEYAVLGMLWLGLLLPGAGDGKESGIGGSSAGGSGTGQSGTDRLGVGQSGIGQACTKRMRLCWYQAWLLASLYAASDEFHQLFVKGRSGQISDVLLDSAGAAAGILLVKLVFVIVGRKK